jgi:hypothetical protein
VAVRAAAENNGDATSTGSHATGETSEGHVGAAIEEGIS